MMVIYKGVIVEEGLSEEVYEHPAHPYTKLLLKAAIGEATLKKNDEIRSMTPRESKKVRKNSVFLENRNTEAIKKCNFYERCPKRTKDCISVNLAEDTVRFTKTHWARCIRTD